MQDHQPGPPGLEQRDIHGASNIGVTRRAASCSKDVLAKSGQVTIRLGGKKSPICSRGERRLDPSGRREIWEYRWLMSMVEKRRADRIVLKNKTNHSSQLAGDTHLVGARRHTNSPHTPVAGGTYFERTRRMSVFHNCVLTGPAPLGEKSVGVTGPGPFPFELHGRNGTGSQYQMGRPSSIWIAGSRGIDLVEGLRQRVRRTRSRAGVWLPCWTSGIGRSATS